MKFHGLDWQSNPNVTIQQSTKMDFQIHNPILPTSALQDEDACALHTGHLRIGLGWAFGKKPFGSGACMRALMPRLLKHESLFLPYGQRWWRDLLLGMWMRRLQVWMLSRRWLRGAWPDGGGVRGVANGRRGERNRDDDWISRLRRSPRWGVLPWKGSWDVQRELLSALVLRRCLWRLFQGWKIQICVPRTS